MTAKKNAPAPAAKPVFEGLIPRYGREFVVVNGAGTIVEFYGKPWPTPEYTAYLADLKEWESGQTEPVEATPEEAPPAIKPVEPSANTLAEEE